MLKRQLARLGTLGMRALFASELEFYLFDESYEAIQAKAYRDPKPAGHYIEDYHIFQTTKDEPVMRAIRNGLYGAGIPVENSKGEWGPGQEEINVRYAEALEMADRHVILKNAGKEIAHARGQAVTFMAKWRYDLAGSSATCTLHSGTSPGAPVVRRSRNPHGMSALMRQYLAGQLAHAREIRYFLAPFINSYKRFQVGTFAPTRAVWSVDNRTSGFRLCGGGRKRFASNAASEAPTSIPTSPSPHCWPRVSTASSSRSSWSHRSSATPIAPNNCARSRRHCARRRICARCSKMLRAAMGDAVVDHYVHAAQWEQVEYDRRITDWELKRGFRTLVNEKLSPLRQEAGGERCASGTPT